MWNDDWEKIETILDEALLLSGEERIRYLRTSCDDDSELLNFVTDLLDSIEKAEQTGFLKNLAGDHKDLIYNFLSSGEIFDNDWIGEIIGPYEIVQLLGTGGMSVVFKAARNDGQFSQTVAIKFMQKEILSPGTVQRFRREQQILAGLNHPHIAQLYDGGITKEGIPYFIMEFIDGKPIDQYCNTEKLTVEERLELFKKVCEAVQFAHSNLIIHRDLKAQNILVTDDGIVKVLDFGIAKLVDPKISHHNHQEIPTGRNFLTPQYAAPEQVKGEMITTATDIYTLGILLHRLLTDRFPLNLEHKSITEVEHIICQEDPARPSLSLNLNSNPTSVSNNRRLSFKELRRKLTGDLDAIVMKALRKDPDFRYSSLDQLIDDINKYKQNLPLLAGTDSTKYRVVKFVERNKGKVATTILFLTIILVLGSYHIHEITNQKQLAEVEANKAKQVTGLMVNLFESEKLNENLMDTLNVYNLLERGKEQIDEISDQPNVQISLILSIGNSYQNIGEHKEAEKLFTKADSLSHTLKRNKSIEGANIASHLGYLHQKINNIETSIDFFTKAINILNEISIKYWRVHAHSLHGLANSLLKANRPDSSEIYIKNAISLKENNGAVTKSILESRISLGKIYHAKGEYRKAEIEYLDILKVIGFQNNYDKKLEAETVFNLGRLFHHQLRYKDAKKFYSLAFDIFKNIYGEKHPKAVSSRLEFEIVQNKVDSLMERN
ncbi:MAG: protein kinase domain-containing protein [Candidatus Halalkalibacterium sp. M3_1C_030]